MQIGLRYIAMVWPAIALGWVVVVQIEAELAFAAGREQAMKPTYLDFNVC
jgi:hypothetical protein